jgi:iron complex outermembrane receptor protein
LGALPYSMTVGGDVYYRSKAMMQPDENPYAMQSGFATLNLHGTIMSENGNYALTLFANNVTNTHYNIDVEDFWASPWQSNAIVVQPARDTDRYFGAKFTYQF